MLIIPLGMLFCPVMVVVFFSASLSMQFGTARSSEVERRAQWRQVGWDG